MRLLCDELSNHFTKRLTEQRTLPTRIHILFDDLTPVLRQRKRIDVFDLLVELILYADQDPAQYLCAIMAVLDDEALIDLERNAVANAATFIRDAMKQDSVRVQLRAYRQMLKGQKKRKAK